MVRIPADRAGSGTARRRDIRDLLVAEAGRPGASGSRPAAEPNARGFSQQATEHDAARVFGGLDAQKLRSSMRCSRGRLSIGAWFAAVLDAYIGGEPDPATDRILAHQPHSPLLKNALPRPGPIPRNGAQIVANRAEVGGAGAEGAGSAAAGWGNGRNGRGAGTPAAGRPGGDAAGEAVLALGVHRLVEGHGGEGGRPVVRAVSGAQIAVVRFDLDQPPGQQLGRREAGRSGIRTGNAQASSVNCRATARKAIAESARPVPDP